MERAQSLVYSKYTWTETQSRSWCGVVTFSLPTLGRLAIVRLILHMGALTKKDISHITLVNTYALNATYSPKQHNQLKKTNK